MEYAQLNEAGTEAIQVNTHGNVEWDSTHFCPANALTQDEAAVFRVVPLTVTTMPAYDAITHRCFRDGWWCALPLGPRCSLWLRPTESRLTLARRWCSRPGRCR